MKTTKIISALLFVLLSSTAFTQNIVYSTFIGGSKDEGKNNWLNDFTIDDSGIVHFAITTESSNFPVTDNAFDKSFNGGNDWGTQDYAIIDFNIENYELTYSSFFGGKNGPDYITKLLYKNGKTYLVGNTGASDFPITQNAYDKTFNGPVFMHADGYVSCFKGTNLEFSTFLGTSGYDWMNDIFVKENGEIVVVGGIAERNELVITHSFSEEKFPETPNLFIATISPNGDSIISSTLLGPVWAMDAATDAAGNIYIVGSTSSPSFPVTTGAYDTSYNGTSGTNGNAGGDLFVIKLSPSGDKILFSTFFGGSGDESWPVMCLDNQNNILIFSYTTSKDIPTTEDAFQKDFTDKTKLFVSKISNDGKKLLYASYFPGESIGNITSTNSGDIIICGSTSLKNHPTTPNAISTISLGKSDAFINVFDSTLSKLEYGTYIGATNDDYAQSIKVDNKGNLILVGTTNSVNFPVSINAYDKVLNGGFDAFLIKISLDIANEIHKPQVSSPVKASIYPNPTNGQISISFGSNPLQQANTEVFNTQGKLLLSKTFHNTSSATIDLTGHPTGIYMIKVIADGVSYEEKIVKE